ncbi:tetratricopeptide repeat protein 19 homolog, mitochondrial isoform X1 [Osmia bicornis bicornis]|uniref:tetratricopeptide repeat protein 19 homolog, mitochondrial isoform X1 n=1 Tax=Osmia bicornis bicornis TaxID=1437191 RepID=UPI0010F56F9C|nr:tetratricopeptide repeat protein 19 homolog, mitochondrial isoform X1 [Osmia bicornis bicornis]XP_029039847.1 tetratricopeptide repeat protein 19 homolog, mitochondrial isoform X1 [Osmia bicornis bicornis]XP_046141985.1 tetratricopeptide repeat protein 19 homolog, mitochondrial isoform X1 [Osmia bicornis bicornis]
MYCQRIITNTFRYAQARIKSNYTAANICLLNLRKGIFTTYLPQINKTKHYKNYNQKNSSQINCFIISSSILFNLFGSKEEKDEVEELKMTIKRSILLIQKKEFEKAEQMLHVALRQAQTLQHYDGITYVYDVMANLAYDTNHFKKAENLFVSVLQRLISKGVPEDDLAVIHISLKIADISSKTGDLEKAEKGFKFCLNNLKNHLAKDSENQDVLQLLGVNLEWYASMLFSHSHYVEALTYFNQAYQICIKINGEEHEETVILLCNLGSVNYMLQKYDQAIEYLSKALELGKKFPDMDDLSSVHINLGNALFAKGLHEEAKKNCNEGKKLAKAKKDNESVTEAEKCLERIQSVMS